MNAAAPEIERYGVVALGTKMSALVYRYGLAIS
jgi:hypothetical protein